MECRVRRGAPADLPAIRQIEQECKETPRWNDAVWGEILVAQGAERVCFVVEAADGVVGFAVAHGSIEPAELESVAVAPAARRRGVGRALCEAAMEWCKERTTVLELEVRASSEGALALYGSLGFREQGRRRMYYRDPQDDAVLMSVEL